MKDNAPVSNLYAVIGNPVEQSKSPLIHRHFAEVIGQNIIYDRILSDEETFMAAVYDFKNNGGHGLNVTAPFKINAYNLATDISEAAQKAGAVNALKFENSKIFGDNFDGSGLIRDCQDNLGIALRGKHILILGAGGAARGILMPVLAENPARLTIANRTAQKANDLVNLSGKNNANLYGCGFSDLGKQHFDIIFNATSSSLQSAPPLPDTYSGIFAAATLAYDLSYGKGLTPFLRAAQSGGTKTIADGIGMLIEQAADSFEWWRGIRPSTADLIRILDTKLG